MKKTGTFFLTKDNLLLGIILGFLGPLFGMLMFYYMKFSYFSFGEFLTTFIHENRLITSIGSICLLVNVALFTVYINTHRDHTAKGIFAITLMYGIGFLLMKLFN